MNSPYSEKEQIAQNYYDNIETDQIYAMIWGGGTYSLWNLPRV